MMVAGAAGLLLPAAPVRGEGADPRVVEAARRCAAGDAHVGVALLMRVHVDTLDPRYVLDQASCLERNGLPGAAAERLKFYLELKGTVPEADRRRAHVTVWLDRLRARDAEPGSRPASDVRRTAVQRQGESQMLSERHRHARPRAMSRQRLGSLLLAGAAGGVLAGATTLHLARENRAAAYNRRCYPLHGASCDQMRGRVQVAQVGAVIGYLAAALLAGGSAYLHATAPERHPGQLHSFRCLRGERGGQLVCRRTY